MGNCKSYTCKQELAALKAENERLTKEAESYRDIAARKSNQVAEMIRAEALSRTGAVKVKALVNSLLDLRDLIMRGKRCVTDTGPAVKPVIELAAVHILDDAANALEALSALEPPAPESQQEAVETRIAWEALECIVARADASKLSPIQYEAAEVAAKIARNALEARGEISPVDFPSGLFPTRPAEQAVTEPEKLITEIEERFPNWRSYRDLIDCIDVTLADLRRWAR